MTKARLRTAILISGRGSNMEALVAASRSAEFSAEIVLVLSNDPAARGLQIAKGAGIPIGSVDHRIHATREDFERTMDHLLGIHRIEFLCLAGFMRLLTPWFVGRWQGRMINIHPALLPSYKGLNTHTRALADGVKIHGCTVHFVVASVDAGPIIMQAAVPVLDDDTPQVLGARVLDQEHLIYPAALDLVASGAATLAGDRVRCRTATADPGRALLQPALQGR